MQQDLSPPKYNLSSSDTQTISKVVQGVIFLGVVPMLYPGVGLPMQRRSKIYQALQETFYDRNKIIVALCNELLKKINIIESLEE